jgi:Uma2 family endonuclease
VGTPVVHQIVAPDDFLAWEREQSERHHYVHGEIFAMAGGSPRHSYLSSRVIVSFGRALGRGSCDVHGSDLRLGIDATHFVYADAVVACRPLELRPGSTDVVTNPQIVVEVLSKTTEAYDRGDKQAGYLALGSLAHFILVSQRERRVERYTRRPDGSFRFTVHGPGSTIELEPFGLALDVDELYDGAFELPGEEPVSI